MSPNLERRTEKIQEEGKSNFFFNRTNKNKSYDGLKYIVNIEWNDIMYV